MKDFDSHTREHQITWRRNNLKNQTPGEHNKVKYPFILPRDIWQEGLWQGIQEGSSQPLSAYLDDNKIDHHTGVHNLRSSWVLCANLYFPFRQDMELMAGFLRQHVSPNIAAVTDIELEYAADSPHDPKTLLGEPEGSRGKNQTSPDVAFIFKNADGSEGIVLTENKFVEHSFYPCSGRKPKYGNPDACRCLEFDAMYADKEHQCYLLSWQADGRENRKYWDFIRISDEGRRFLKKCPAAVAGYQLFRQQALAEALIHSGRFPQAISCVAYDARNETLQRCLKSTGIDKLEYWGKLFSGKAQFSTFTHQQWVSWVEHNDISGKWDDWICYVKNRYGF
ncbi:MAG: hypothetical protein AB9919_13050 [Geobacteraceae bacterium]